MMIIRKATPETRHDPGVAMTWQQAEAIALRSMPKVDMLCGMLNGKPSNGYVDAWAAFETSAEWYEWKQQFKVA